MPRIQRTPIQVPVPGGKVINEHMGLASTGDAQMSVAHMVAPAGWDEPAQTPAFDEVTLVLRGAVIVEHDGTETMVNAGESIVTRAGERVRYRTGAEGAEYVAICTPAFSPENVHREENA